MMRSPLVVLGLLSAAAVADAQSTRAPAIPYTVGGAIVREGRFSAIAMSRDTILSTWPRAAREVRFRFSINGAENEFPPGTEHTIYLRPTDGQLVTRVYRFGDETEPPPPTAEESAGSEEGVARVTFRVDLRHVLGALRDRGFWQPPLGARIERGGLRHVYVLGDPAPLSWDYATLRPGTPQELTDADGDGIYEGTVEIQTEYTRPRDAGGRAMWARTLDLSGFPTVESSQLLQDAIYRLSLEELRQLVRADGALQAGAKWPGVWTRDVSLAGILSLALVAPDALRASLLAKVDSSGRIIQDTGTGGSWPVSTDRMVWALAAWELYAATGDRDWLRRAYDVVRRSAEADLHAARDVRTGLFNGESSFLDWREQSYPRWMQPADIYRSQNLGTNAVHFAAHRALAEMARALGEDGARWDRVADGVRAGITAHLWQPGRGWFGQYRYGRTHLALSPRAEGLGEALASIHGAASPAQRSALGRSMPLVAYGTPTFYPFIPGERFYHNGTIWPFVTAYWTWAAAEGGDARAVRHGLDALTRGTALFLTNKENLVAATGHYEGTALNNDRQLWSVAGSLAVTYRVLLGLRLEAERLVFRPMVPPTYGGTRTVRGLRWRDATLDVTVRGHGDGIASIHLDDQPLPRAELPASLAGAHRVEIVMNGRWREGRINLVRPRFAPATPVARLEGGALVWSEVAGAVRYVVHRNGRPLATVTGTRHAVRVRDGLDEYQVLAVNAAGDQSFLGEPVRVLPAEAELALSPLVKRTFSHAAPADVPYTALERGDGAEFVLQLLGSREAEYAIDVRYANGSGPVNTEDKVAVRTLLVGDDTAGVVVMPQRGTNAWSDWGWSNAVRMRLKPGTHRLYLAFTRHDENMNGKVNTALVNVLRVTRLASEPAR